MTPRPVPAEKRCSRCNVGDHERCTGLTCECSETNRCKANARLTAERSPDLGGDAA